MENNKLETISNLFEDNEIRSVWDSEKGEYYFSVVDVIAALTDSNIPRNYWSDLKRKLRQEGSQLHENIVQLKMKAADGKMRETDTLATKGILRLIESIPSPKAEPFKLWLAKMGGHTAKVAREDLEKNLGKTVISNSNALDYKYLDTDNLDSNKILREGKMINYSYVMGIDNINKLQENNFEIKSYGNNYGISFSSDKIEMFENFIFETLQNGFWNEYLGKEKVFIFKFNDGKIKRYVLNKENEKEILNLCQEFADCKFESIDKMLRDNDFYAETYFKN